MSARNRVRYGALPDEEEFEDPASSPSQDENEASAFDSRNRKSHSGSSQKRSIFEYILLFFGKVILFVFVTLPKFIFRLFTGTSRTNRGKQKPSHHIWKRLFKLCLKLVLVLGILLVGYTFWISKDLLLLDPNRLRDRQLHQSTNIYDRTGQHLLYQVFTDQKRTLVTLDKIPLNLRNGLIATEDTAFYKHHGIRPLSIIRSVVYGIIGRGNNRIGGGASTLTQQLIKNAVLVNEGPFTRKPKEVILSLRLEQKYTKDEILQIYFNEIPYGSTNYGVEAAAQSYFGKSVSELDLEQSATLAGFPKAPSKYLNNPDALKERRNFVLRRMKEEGYITEDQMKEAQAKPLTFSRRVDNITAPHFVFYVKDQLDEMYDEKTVDAGGLNVITSLDYDAQIAAEKAIKDKEKLLNQAGANNAALVALDPRTGQILAYVGSKDFFNNDIQGQFDIVTQARRQPGSSIKPIIYAAAFEKGYTPDTVLFDVITNFSLSGTPYIPKNYTLAEYGPVTMRQALQGSLNIPAVKTFYLVGEKKGIEFANRLGYTTFNSGTFGLSLVLGGGEVSMLEHVNAYGVFANNGAYNKPVSILKVTSPTGDTLYEWKKAEPKQVVDAKVAATLTNVLSDDGARAYIFGAGGPLTLSGRPVAAKTGTTNGYKDAWTVGYTPSVVAGVWTGNSNNKEMKQGYGGSKVSGDIWHGFMVEYLKGKPVETFPAPPPNDAEKPVLRGASGGGVTLDVNKVTGKIATSSTPPQYIEQKTYIQPHDILHYVNKDDPRGPYPENPASDPQYMVWEKAIQDWIQRRKTTEPNWNISFEEPPKEFDDAESLAFIPSLTVLSPTPGEVLNSRQITTSIQVSAPRGVSKVTYFIDKRAVGIVNTFPFNLDTYVRDIENGAHELTLRVEDDIGNHLEQSIPFTLQAQDESPYVTWVRGGTSLSRDDFPASFFLNPFKINKIREIRVYTQKDGGSRSLLTVVSDFSNLFNDQITITWPTPPETGAWKLSSEITTDIGTVITGDTLNITVN